MAERTSRSSGARLNIEVSIVDADKDELVPDLVAYTFTHSGRLLARTPIKGNESALPVPSTKEPENRRVVIGPSLEEIDDHELLATLDRLHAPESLVGPHQLKEKLLVPIDRPIWACWLRFCLVRGTLLKRVTTGGINIDLPSCGAEIEIYEVDPILVILPKIPDVVLERIRDQIRKPWPPPPPPEERFKHGIAFPPRPPVAGPDLSKFVGSPELERRGISPFAGTRGATVVASAGALRNEVTTILDDLRGSEAFEAEASTIDGAPDEVRSFNFPSGEATEVDQAEAMASIRAIHDVAEIRSAAHVSLEVFKTSLVAHPALIQHLICWLWPPAVNMQLVATATTDECGKFRARIYTGCSSDVPDLYFKAYRRIGFFRIQIYGPLPVPCFTWWNYACGTEVTLATTSPFALTCPPCKPVIAPPHWVLAMAVGNTSLAAVNGTSLALQPTTDASNIGLTSGAPFGGYIRLRFEFDNTIRTDLNVKYYRLRWRKIGSGNPFVDMTEDVWRHFAHMVGSTLMIEPYRLGPQPVGGTPNLYEIPPALPPLGQWSIPDPVVDTTSAAFASATLAPHNGGEGDYQFEVTLFDAAGAAVNATALGVNYVIPTTLDLTATIPTTNAAALGLVTASGRLVYQLHIDNNSCDAGLQPPQMAGSISADPCGLLRYGTGASVTITDTWTAFHPHQFARFKHSIVKGVTELPAPITSSGPVTASPGTHVQSFAVSDLVGSCLIAGFAETVSVWATATDGWSRQSQYDDHAIQAFALAPEQH